jgi:peptidoglycan/LPS O-acetylase OafA/YrhL
MTTGPSDQIARAATAYRPQIDGLRAVAVLAIILFHTDPRLVPGGYLGVDVFFVISGFLITSLIIAELERGAFSLLRFYERRIRRILPVLFVVLAATLPFAALYLLPSQQAAYARSLLTTLFFSSNILFWQETGYFMAEADLKPLLHTWSLGVEEQLYLLFPAIMLALWRFGPKARVAGLGLMFAASLVGSTFLAARAPGANFYLLSSRAWELLAGALLAVAVLRGIVHSRFAGLLGLAGLAMVVGSLALFEDTTPMPSAIGLIPVGGTVLLIAFATERTLAGRILGWRPLVLIGLISYSAYLWHWPVLVFARFQFGDALAPGVLAGLVAAVLGLSFLSWRFIEQPFRRRGARAWMPIRPLLATLVAAAAFLIVLTQSPGLRIVGGPSLVTDAMDPTTPANIEAKIATNYGLSEECEGAFTLSPACRTSDAPEVLLWGDSFAMHLAPAIVAGVGARGMVQHTKSVCVPIEGISVVTAEYPATWADGCIAFNDQVLDWLSGQSSIRYVVVSSPFGIIFNDVYQRGGAVAAAPSPDLVRQQLIKTAARVRGMGKTLVIVSPPPVTGENIGQCLASAALRGDSEDACDFPSTRIHALSRLVFDFLHALSSEVPVVFLDELTCAEGICDTRIGDIFIFRDSGHLSIEASRYLGDERAFYHRIQLAAAP